MWLKKLKEAWGLASNMNCTKMTALPPFRYASDIPSTARLAYMSKQALLDLLPRAGIAVPEKTTKQILIAHLNQKRDELQEAGRQRVRDAEAERNRQAQAALDIHRQTRSYASRRQEGVESMLGALDYPLSYLGEYGGTHGILKPLVGQEEIVLADDAFPTEVAEYLWIHPGENDEEPWKAVGRLESGVHFFYKAECDYTGFDCQGGMELYVAKDLRTLIDLAMGIRDYDQWMAETVGL